MLDGKILEFDSYRPNLPDHTGQFPNYADAHPRFRGGGTSILAVKPRFLNYAFAPFTM